MVTRPLNLPREAVDGKDIPVAPPTPGEATEAAAPQSLDARAEPEWRVLFHMTGPKPSTVGLDVWRVTVLGRADPMSAFRPDLDYAPYGAMRFGVSRRHALLRPSKEALYMIDQSSTNGTWVNGQRLLPGQGYQLSDGDIIELGALRMILRIERSPAEAAGKKQGRGRMRGRGFRSLLGWG